MTVRQIIAEDVGNMQLRLLYQTAFPRDEQIPWEELMGLIAPMHLDFSAYYDGGELLGFTIVQQRPTFNWFWYCAVPEHLRGQGIGQKILTHLIDKYRDSMNLMDMESPRQVCDNAEQRKRRYGFYLRNGFRDTNVYRTYGNIEMTILMNGEGTFTMHDWDEITRELRSYWHHMPEKAE